MPPRSGAPLPTSKTLLIQASPGGRRLCPTAVGDGAPYCPTGARERLSSRRMPEGSEPKDSRVSAEKSPTASRLLWCLRKYWWLVAACVVVGASAPLVLTPSAPVYQADALVFARQLNMNPR